MMQSNRWLIVGESGSGKSYWGGSLLDSCRDAGLCSYTVVVSPQPVEASPFASRCAQFQEVDDELAASDIDLAPGIKAAKSIYFELTAADPNDFMERLVNACFALGDVCLVIDEINESVTSAARPGTLRAWTRGRHANLSVIGIAQSMKQRGKIGINPIVVNRSSALVCFQVLDQLEIDQVARQLRNPRASELLPELKTPLDGNPEYIVRDLKRGVSVMYSREGRVSV